MPSSERVPCVGEGSLWLAAALGRGAGKEGPPMLGLSALHNSAGCHLLRPGEGSFWSYSLYLSRTESGASRPTPSSPVGLSG